jgi:hypothetical protein
MALDQANEGASIALTSDVFPYVADQWRAGYSGAATGVTAQWVSDAPSQFNHSIKLTVGTGAAVGVTDFLSFIQPIAVTSIIVSGVGTSLAQHLFLSFWVKSSISNYTASGSLRNPAATRSFPFNFKITAANTWERKVISIPGDTTGTWVAGSGQGGSLYIVAATGATYQGTANTWAATNYIGTSLNTNTILSTSGATFQISGVKLEVSPYPTDFDSIITSEEFGRCLFFYEKSYSNGTAPGTISSAGISLIFGTGNGPNTGTNVRYSSPKRGTPIVTMYSPTTGASGKVHDYVAAADVTPSVTDVGRTGFLYTIGTGSSLINIQAQWVADARF